MIKIGGDAANAQGETRAAPPCTICVSRRLRRRRRSKRRRLCPASSRVEYLVTTC